MRKTRWISLVLLPAIFLAACASQPTHTVEPAASGDPSRPISATVTLQPTVTAGPASATPTAWDYGSEGVLSAEQNNLLNQVVADLAARLQVESEAIRVNNFQSVEWPDAALGCPLPGANYAQVLTPGYQIELKAQGELYEYHANDRFQYFLCLDGQPQLPALPVKSGDIDDGQPWIPIEPGEVPLPTLTPKN